MSASINSSARWVERRLTAPFKWAGWRGVARRLVPSAIVGSLAWGFISMIIGGLAVRMSWTELVWAQLINSSAIVVAMAVLWWRAFRDVAVFEAWEAADRPAGEAAHVLRLVLTSPVRWATWATATYSLLAFPTIFAWVAVTMDDPVLGILLCLGGFSASTIVAWTVGVFVMELGTRPVIARVAAEFPHVSVSEGRGMSLRTRALLPVPAVTMTTGISVGALAGRFDPFGQIVSAMIISLVFTVAIAAMLRVSVTEAALRPVDDLIDGVERVARGDLASRVPITGGDELAVLGRAVNEMTERLAAHDAELRASRTRIVAASDEARRNVERDLHDGAQQYLVLLELKLGMLTKAVADDDLEAVAALTAEVREDLGRALSELRDLAHGIYPAVLESDGLPAALQAAAERSSIPVTVDSDGVRRYPQELEAAIYFCCLEALQNAAKHAGDGAKVSVRLGQDDGRVQFEVSDDGRGYDAAAMGPSAGLQNMADRIGALGGELRIDSTPGAGTTVRGSVPIGVAT
jgi:signal transduction histidine kinase